MLLIGGQTRRRKVDRESTTTKTNEIKKEQSLRRQEEVRGLEHRYAKPVERVIRSFSLSYSLSTLLSCASIFFVVLKLAPIRPSLWGFALPCYVTRFGSKNNNIVEEEKKEKKEKKTEFLPIVHGGKGWQYPLRRAKGFYENKCVSIG